MIPAMPVPGGPALRIQRRYDATLEEIFEAFTDPALLRQWWHPRDFVVERLDFRAIEGRPYRIELRAPDGTRFAHVGVVLRVSRPDALVYTWRWVEGPLSPVETLVELGFRADGDGVIVDLCHSRFENQAECDRHVGWRQAFDALDAWLAQRAGRATRKP
ncbi:MAG: SRPBCC domain-containing protein [Vicinamibacterales bacterium]